MSEASEDFERAPSRFDLTAALGDPETGIGRLLFDAIYRTLKIGSIYELKHSQTKLAVARFFELLEADAFPWDPGQPISLTLRGELAVVNGTTLRLDRRAQRRHDELRAIFEGASIRGLLVRRGVRPDDLLAFLRALNDAAHKSGSMRGFSNEFIELEHGSPERSLADALARVDKAKYVAHLYVRGLVKVSNMFDQVRERGRDDLPFGVVRRIVQTVADLLADNELTIVGLLAQNLFPADLASHSFNAAIYGMLLADRIGLGVSLVSQLGGAIVMQDIDRTAGVFVAHRDRDRALAPERQFRINLRDVAQLVPSLEGDSTSTLRALLTYERGCPLGDTVRAPYYRGARDLHLVSRIVDVARAYDLLVQGLEGYRRRRPERALRYLESRAEEAFDPSIVELLIAVIGVYPIGSVVELSDQSRAVVVRAPEAGVDPRRPLVRSLGPDARLLDLSAPAHAALSVRRSTDPEPGDLPVARAYVLT